MEQAATKQDEKIGRGFILSILLHVILAAIFLLRPLMMPPQAAPEENVNVELVPQPQEQQENATKPKEASRQVPTPTPKPDETAQQAEAQKQPEQKPGDPKAQSDQQDKAEAEKAAPPASNASSNTPTPKPEQQASTEETPSNAKADPPNQKPADQPDTQMQQADTTSKMVPNKQQPNLKADQDASSAQQADALSRENATLSPKLTDNQPKPETATSTDVDANTQAAGEQAAANTQDEPQANAAPATNSDSHPEEVATDRPSGTKTDQPDTSQTDAETKVDAALSSSVPDPQPQQRAPADNAVTNSLAPEIVLPRSTVPQPRPQVAGEAVASDIKSQQQEGAALVVEPEAPREPLQSSAGHGSGNEVAHQDSTEPTPQSTKQGSASAEKTTGLTKFEAQMGPFVQAKRFYSSKQLAGAPKSFLAQWKGLPAQIRMSQLCNAEAAAQLNAAGIQVIRFGLPQSTQTSNLSRSIETDNAVYRTPDGYHFVGVKCGVDAGVMKVTSFAYRLGTPIPQDKWRSLNLPAD